ncbi:hypothetical protein OU798_08020 [Prolixibacteraceae bacterium Z1-6]|uniref:Uncharacterized protein n=1 Tax=Draconibacterium aestuarii TaxID=2998507 RepID=A0A9X3J6A3_9BACT|nr:hypothetical protein [Prolixibacteraceae bacterium Z1-6]
MKKLSLIIATVLVLGVAKISKAQVDSESASHGVSFEVPQIAILDIEGGENIELNLGTIVEEAGDGIDLSGVTNDQLWLNYTVLTGTGQNGRAQEQKIYVSIDNAIPGINLMLKVGADEGAGAGANGTPSNSSAIVVDDEASTEIISGIGSSYTGDGTNKGHNLAYSLEVGDFEELVAGSHSVTVTYTFTDNN